MKIYHTAPPLIYKSFPEFTKESEALVIHEIDITHMTIGNIKSLKHLSNNIIFYLHNFISKNEIQPIISMLGTKKIIYPVESLDNIHELEITYADSSINIIADIIANNEREYTVLLYNVLKSKVIKGVGLDYIHMLNSFPSIPLFALRPRAIEHMNVILGLSLYDKEIYCLRMCGALPEILLTKTQEFITATITDVALSLALNGIRIDDSNLLPTDFDMDFVNKNSIDCPKSLITVEKMNSIFDLVKHNIQIMREHNG